MSVLTQSGNRLPKMGLPISKAANAGIVLSNTVKLHIGGWEGGHREKQAEKDNFANEKESQTQMFSI